MLGLRSGISEHALLQWFSFIFQIKSRLLRLYTKPFMNRLGPAEKLTDLPSSLHFLGFLFVLLWNVLAPHFWANFSMELTHCHFF